MCAHVCTVCTYVGWHITICGSLCSAERRGEGQRRAKTLQGPGVKCGARGRVYPRHTGNSGFILVV